MISFKDAKRLLSLAASTAATFLLMASRAQAQCPAVGQDTTCGTIITISDNGVSIQSTGQGPYDGIEDTLVGVVNKSSQPISRLGLRSSQTIFGFDGDGLVTYGVPGNSQDSTGYGGPNAYFTNIEPGLKSGVVNFIAPLAANGGTTFFALEEAISSAFSCKDIVNKAVSVVPLATTMTATFTPKLGLSLQQAAAGCGFVNFDWQQRITNLPAPSPYFQLGNPVALTAPPSFLDPPPGGYTYQTPPDDSYPFYYDPATQLLPQETPFVLSFSDTPADSCLPGGRGASCGGKTAPAGSFIGFTTRLVGVNANRTATDLGIGFNWKTTFNGTSGGVSRTKNDLPVDPGSGTGGVTVTGIQETTDYEYNGVTVTTINGVPVNSLRIVSLNASLSQLWPPNGKMVPVSIQVGTSGGNGDDPVCSITNITSNEQPTHPKEPDWIVTGPLALSVRAERAGFGPGRIYSVSVTCTDASTSVSNATTITVPHDQRK